jgi:hypothetical protein
MHVKLLNDEVPLDWETKSVKVLLEVMEKFIS